MKTAILACLFLAAAPLGAAAASAIAPMPYRSVAQALADLQSRDGQSTIVTHADGWTIVNEPAAGAQWSFVPKDHAAYPAAVRRVILRGPSRAVSVDTQSLCEGPAPACEKLLQEFEALNERIVQSARSRAMPVPAR